MAKTFFTAARTGMMRSAKYPDTARRRLTMTDGIPGALREIGRQNPFASVALNMAADEIHGLWQAIECARRSTGYQRQEFREWFDHYFPQKPGEPPPFDLTDPRHKPDEDDWIGSVNATDSERPSEPEIS